MAKKPFLVSFLRGARIHETGLRSCQKWNVVCFDKHLVRVAGADCFTDTDKINYPILKNSKSTSPSGTFAYDEPAGIHFGSFTLRADED